MRPDFGAPLNQTPPNDPIPTQARGWSTARGEGVVGHSSGDGWMLRQAGGKWARSWDVIAGRSLGAPPELEAKASSARAQIVNGQVYSDPS